MYIKTFQDQVESSPQIDTHVRTVSKIQLPISRNDLTQLQKVNMCKSLLRESKSSGKQRAKQQQVIVISPELYQANYFGSNLKNNRIREIKNRDKIRQKIKQKIKEQFVQTLQRAATSHRSRTPNCSELYKHLNASVDGKSVPQVQRAHEIKPASADCLRRSVGKNTAVLDFTRLKRNQQNKFVENKHRTKSLIKPQSLIRQSVEGFEKGGKITPDYRVSKGSGRGRKPSSSTKKDKPKDRLEKNNRFAEYIQPWVVQDYEDQQLLF